MLLIYLCTFVLFFIMLTDDDNDYLLLSYEMKMHVIHSLSK